MNVVFNFLWKETICAWVSMEEKQLSGVAIIFSILIKYLTDVHLQMYVAEACGTTTVSPNSACISET